MCVRRGIHIELSLLFITNGKLNSTLDTRILTPIYFFVLLLSSILVIL